MSFLIDSIETHGQIEMIFLGGTMKIIVHRGTHQIGGCITEIVTEQARVFIDMGSELPDEEGNIPSETLLIEGVTTGSSHCNGVFFTHYHGDHIGMLSRILPDVPLFMGQAAKEIYLALQVRLHSELTDSVERIKTFRAGNTIIVGDMAITPFMIDHSAYDAYMFLIESGGKKVLHTGDFRTHGFRGKGVLPMLKKYVGQVDVLITEGTTLSRDLSPVLTEHELQNQVRELLTSYPYVFVVCSSTNIDRLASFHEATPRGKYYLCDAYQKTIIDIACEYGKRYSSLYAFNKALVYNTNLDEKMGRQGFCMMVRGNSYFLNIMNLYKKNHDEKSLVIYSMWDGYLNQSNNRIGPLLGGFQNTIHLHTSGHASRDAIIEVCNAVSPRQAIIPIHSSMPKQMDSLGLTYSIKHLKDREAFELN